jgi:hypothetical protein
MVSRMKSGWIRIQFLLTKGPISNKQSAMIKTILFITGVLFMSLGCRRSDNNQIHGVQVAGSIPAVLPDTSYTMSNSYDIFYYDDLIMYRFKYGFDSIVNGKVLLHESRPNFFVFHKDSAFGYSYYPYPDSKPVAGRNAVDTLFNRNAYSPFKFDSLFHYKPDSSYFDAQRDLVKVYNYALSDTAEKFTYYLYFSKKFKGLADGFFSRSMADKDGMKLFRIRIAAHGHYYPEYKMALPPRELLYEMKEIPVTDTAGLMIYFTKYKKDVLKT